VNLRVMFVNHTGLVSGAERSLLDMLPCLSARITPSVASPRGELATLVSEVGIRHITIPAAEMSFHLDLRRTPVRVLSSARALGGLAAVIRRERPDVVVANSTRAGLLAGFVPRPARTRLVVWVHDALPAGRVARLVRTVTWSRADLVLVNSRYVAGDFEGPRRRGQARVLYNGIDPSESDRNAPGAVGFNPGTTLRLAILGQITPWKQQHVAVRILRDLVDLGVDATLDVIGAVEFRGPGRYDTLGYERELRRSTSDLALSGRVRFLGRREDARALLAENHILLVPSTIEPFGRVVVEGMLARNVVIAGDVGGPAEIIEHGSTGFLLPSANPTEWTSLISALVGDWQVATEIGSAAHKSAVSRFGRRQMADAFVAYVGTVMETRGSGQGSAS
jgi:glycosyltransferase involved in cell wall biosynthesis